MNFFRLKMAVTLAKNTLRKELKKRLASMSTDERIRQSKIVTEKVVTSKMYERSQRICLYLSMDEEVSTKELLAHIFDAGKHCFVPRYTKDGMDMLRLHSMDDYLQLPLTNWNIRQPEGNSGREEALESGGLDLIIVPGLGFTKEGHRLGRGKGYYDVYLEKCKKVERPLISIALAFKEQMVDLIPVTENDARMNFVFYPS